MPQSAIDAAHPVVGDVAVATATMVAPVSVTGWMLMGHPVEDWVVLGTLLQLCLTLPYWIWRISRDVRQSRRGRFR